MSAADRTTIIIAPPPTPNGDLHVGHLAGPYLAGDVHARYLRAAGRPVIYATGTDDSQTYVLATARKRGTTPERLAAESSTAIERTLRAAGVSIDGFAPFDDGYRGRVLEFLGALHDQGRFRLRTLPLPYLESTGEFLMEGLVAGGCPVCRLDSRGGLCESCGHPNLGSDLLEPYSTTDPSAPVSFREATILVLPMEEYRDRLEQHYAARRDRLRPHLRQLVDEALARPLPDFPITYPAGWGIEAPFPETPGQVLNAWAEGMAASMYCTWWAAGRPDTASDEQWLEGPDGARLVYFLGFDNAYFWGMTHLALLMAHGGRYVEPDSIVTNEFYELENEKFSTSRGHVVWTADLLAEVPRDAVRFYLALTAPEHARTNFSRSALEALAQSRLAGPWNRFGARLGQLLARTPAVVGGLPTSAAGRAGAAAVLDRFRACYELDGFSLHRAASELAAQLDRLVRAAQQPSPSPGDLLLLARTLLACAAPIVVDATAAAGIELSLTDEAVSATRITPFAWPPLAAPGAGAAGLAA